MRKLLHKLATPELLTDNTRFYLIEARFPAAPQPDDPDHDDSAQLVLTKRGSWLLESRRTTLPQPVDTNYAVAWLFANGHTEASRHYARKAVGRPPIGPKVETRLGELLPQVEDYAKTCGMKRSEAIRALVAIGLEHTDLSEGA